MSSYEGGHMVAVNTVFNIHISQPFLARYAYGCNPPTTAPAHRRNLGCCCISRHHAEVAENLPKKRGTREFCVARTCRQPVHLVIAGGGRVLTSPQHVLPPILLQRGSTLPRGGCELTPPRVRPLSRAVRLRHRPLMPGTCGRPQPRTPHRWRGRGNGVRRGSQGLLRAHPSRL